MPEIENDRISIDIDWRLITIAIQALSRWTAAGIVNKDFQMKIQFSRQSLNNSAFPALMQKELDRYQIDADQIIAELPSRTSTLDHQVLTELEELGFSIAINSESAEPNVLQLLPALRPDIALLGEAWQANFIMLPHLVAACHELDIDLLARNVNNHELLLQLQELGIKRFQGMIFEKPLTAVDFISRWGQTRLAGLGKNLSDAASFKVAV
jgi:EAL domain-containing protein (putative c-di-GMP-specific phosphodiesterase class I)